MNRPSLLWNSINSNSDILTNSLLRPYTSHRWAHPVLWHQEKWSHGEWWSSWWSHWRGPGRRPGPGSLEWAWAWDRSIWPSCMGPSCSHHCTGTDWKMEKTGWNQSMYKKTGNCYRSRDRSRYNSWWSLNLLVEEGKEVAHDNEDWSGDGQEDLTDVQCSLVQIFDSWEKTTRLEWEWCQHCIN